jgi:hypothetical protein
LQPLLNECFEFWFSDLNRHVSSLLFQYIRLYRSNISSGGTATKISLPPILQTVFNSGRLKRHRRQCKLCASASYLPTQDGCRFPKNAEIPSWASAARVFMLITSLA